MEDLIYTYAIPLILSIGVVTAYVVKVSAVLKEVGEVIDAVIEAVADGKILKEEVQNIAKESKDVIPALKALLNK